MILHNNFIINSLDSALINFSIQELLLFFLPSIKQKHQKHIKIVKYTRKSNLNLKKNKNKHFHPPPTIPPPPNSNFRTTKLPI
jgi:hypothetical protein